jgi:hypothetical protein
MIPPFEIFIWSSPGTSCTVLVGSSRIRNLVMSCMGYTLMIRSGRQDGALSLTRFRIEGFRILELAGNAPQEIEQSDWP